MKSLWIFSFGLSVTASTFLMAEEKTPAAERHVTVAYEAPENFTDFTSSGFGSASDQDLKYLTGLLTAHIEKLAKKLLPADERLEITFKDIDLAGQFEPERGPNFQNVRIFRDITFPRMHFGFRLLGSDGTVLAEGERKLTDLNYNMKIHLPTSDSDCRYDKELLTDWMNAEFGKKKT